MKRNEILLEVPHMGEVLLEPFKYSNGREGYMCVVETDGKTRKFNLTINPLDLVYNHKWDISEMYLKMHGEAEVVSRHLMKVTDMFRKNGIFSVGLNYAIFVNLNTEYYER